MVGFHQDVTIRGELRASGRDDAGGSGTRHRPGAHGPRHNARGTPEENHEQRDSVTGADVRHLAGFPRVTATATSNPANGSHVEIGTEHRYSMDLTNSRLFGAPRRVASEEGDNDSPVYHPGLVIT